MCLPLNENVIGERRPRESFARSFAIDAISCFAKASVKHVKRERRREKQEGKRILQARTRKYDSQFDLRYSELSDWRFSVPVAQPCAED